MRVIRSDRDRSSPRAPALREAIEGRWRSPGGNSIIEIAPCGSDMCGTVAWASDKGQEGCAPRRPTS